MLQVILNKSRRQHPTRHQLYDHLPPITKTIQARRTRHAGHCWRSRDELISGVFLWTPIYGRAKAGRPARTYIQQLCEDMGCSPEDLSEAMNDREKWREGLRDICACGTTWWWYLIYMNILYPQKTDQHEVLCIIQFEYLNLDILHHIDRSNIYCNRILYFSDCRDKEFILVAAGTGNFCRLG